MENSCNTRKIENVTRFHISLKWSHFLVTLFVTLLGTKRCYNTKSEHFSNKNVTFCYIFALTPLIPPMKNSGHPACNIFRQKVTKYYSNQKVTKYLIKYLIKIIHLRIIAVLSRYTFCPNKYIASTHIPLSMAPLFII